jgi:hypothetical protein
MSGDLHDLYFLEMISKTRFVLQLLLISVLFLDVHGTDKTRETNVERSTNRAPINTTRKHKSQMFHLFTMFYG